MVDEGHELGRRDVTSVTPFISEIASERRWVLSGTPTTGNDDAANEAELLEVSKGQLQQLQRLLQFLRHPVYGRSSTMVPGLDDSTTRTADRLAALERWDSDVALPFVCGHDSGRQRLLELMQQVMVHHRKEHLALPRPTFSDAELSVPVPAQYVGQGPTVLQAFLATEEFQVEVDRMMGGHIAERIRAARREVKEGKSSRSVKGVVFSQHENDLQSVAEHLYEAFGHEALAEHWGGVAEASAEISRFRNGWIETKGSALLPLVLRASDSPLTHNSPASSHISFNFI